MATILGSREHFQQVINAHVVTPFGSHTWCRCGANVGAPTDAAMREHIRKVWAPWPLPEGW